MLLLLAGSWKRAAVAVKVIVHNASMARKVDTLRESLVGISMQHPHVVSTRTPIDYNHHHIARLGHDYQDLTLRMSKAAVQVPTCKVMNS